jgi:hypothetical protein
MSFELAAVNERGRCPGEQLSEVTPGHTVRGVGRMCGLIGEVRVRVEGDAGPRVAEDAAHLVSSSLRSTIRWLANVCSCTRRGFPARLEARLSGPHDVTLAKSLRLDRLDMKLAGAIGRELVGHDFRPSSRATTARRSLRGERRPLSRGSRRRAHCPTEPYQATTVRKGQRPKRSFT